jgi:hypothetical protein
VFGIPDLTRSTMAQTTPGRRARASTRVEQAYVPFNAKPKEVGT